MNEIFCSVDDNGEPVPLTDKKYRIKKAKEEKLTRDNALASIVAAKFLLENTNINFEAFINQIKINIMSSVDCSELLGISPKAFIRLKKKYNIEPIYTAKNKSNSLFPMSHMKNKYATKNFYSKTQLSKIPQKDIELAQLRSARSLSFPEGKGILVKWKRRGRHTNGKLKARIDNLIKFGVPIMYNREADTYSVHLNGQFKHLSRKEVDKLNSKYNKMKVFI